jgi:integrase
MRGCVKKRQLPSGTVDWYFSVRVGKDENGKPLRVFRSGFRRKADAEEALLKVQQERHDGTMTKPVPKTFGELADEWLTKHAPVTCGSKKTLERYRQLLAYALPHLGGTQIREISTLMLDRLYAKLLKSGGKNGRPLKGTVHHIASLIRAILRAAVRWNLMKVNPADSCQLKKREKREVKVLDMTQTQVFIEAARGHYLQPILEFAAATGCRRGEILAVCWRDLDLTNGWVSISKSLEQTKEEVRVKSPKNGKARPVKLPDSTVEMLRSHRLHQAEQKKLFGADYRDDLDLVFAALDGTFLKPDTVTAEACRQARKVGLDGIGLHTLRHSHGSQMLSQGAPLPTVSKRLGHSNVAVTASVYAHAFQKDEIEATTAWNEAKKLVSARPTLKQ